MSMLIKQLQKVELNSRGAFYMPPILSAKEAVVEEAPPVAYKYSFQATIGFEGCCGSAAEVELLRKQARWHVAQAVFGEFRQYIYAIDKALWANDRDAARKACNDMLKAMFDVEDLE